VRAELTPAQPAQITPALARSPYAGTSYQLNILCAPVPVVGGPYGGCG
jgi:hypothetical protein